MRLRPAHFVPPLLKAAWGLVRPPQPLFTSFQAAAAASGPGYEDPRLVATMAEKTRRYRDALASARPPVLDLSTRRTLVGLALGAVDDDMHVLDFGGACGVHYFIARAFLRGRVRRFRWHIVETPSTVAAGGSLEDGELRFFDNLDAAVAGLGPVDLVFSSGALQGLADPYSALERLTSLGASAVYLSWLGLTTGERELLTVQTSRLSASGPGPLPSGLRDERVKVPVHICRKDRVEAILAKRYAIELAFHEEPNAYMPGNRGVDMYGYFARAKPR